MMTPWAHRVLEVGSLVNKLERCTGAISRSQRVLNVNLRSYKIKVSNKELFLYTHTHTHTYLSAQVLVVTCRMFSCSIRDLVP